jgi:sodium-dependent dicarboxylate transporter 2/3/5
VAIACALVTFLTGKGPSWVNFALTALFFAEFSSNITTASIFVPMVGRIADKHQTHPLIYTLPVGSPTSPFQFALNSTQVAFSASFAFMFPAGTPPNAIIFGLKMLRVSDMVSSPRSSA